MKNLLTLLLTAMLVPACACPTGGAEGVADAASPVVLDAGAGGGPAPPSDAASPRSDAGIDAHALAVGACRRATEEHRDLCVSAEGPGSARARLWRGYRDLCEVGNTALLLGALDCLDRTSCTTFSEPGDALACLHALHEASPTSLTEVHTSQCQICGDERCEIGLMEGTPYLLPSERDALKDCSRGADCSAQGLLVACSALPGLGGLVVP